VIDPGGTVRQRTAVSEQAVLQATVGRREGTTVYTRLGLLPGLAVALAGVAVAAVLARRTPRPPDPAVHVAVVADVGPDAEAPDPEVADDRPAVPTAGDG
jgi:hypothetical protein